MFPFSPFRTIFRTPWKRQKTFWFFDVFRGQNMTWTRLSTLPDGCLHNVKDIFLFLEIPPMKAVFFPSFNKIPQRYQKHQLRGKYVKKEKKRNKRLILN